MSKIVRAVAFAFVFVFAVAYPTYAFDDKDCSDFSTWREAQDFFERNGGPTKDPHRLDRDGDGIACEELSGAPGSHSAPNNGNTNNENGSAIGGKLPQTATQYPSMGIIGGLMLVIGILMRRAVE